MQNSKKDIDEVAVSRAEADTVEKFALREFNGPLAEEHGKCIEVDVQADSDIDTQDVADAEHRLLDRTDRTVPFEPS